jgi:hypothetical protein
MKELHVTAFHRYELPEDRLRGAAIELPLGEKTDAYRLAVEGWVAGRGSEPTYVELLDGGRPLLRLPATRSPSTIEADSKAPTSADQRRFTGSLGALKLKREFEVLVRVAFDDGGHALLGSIRGKRTPLSTSFQPRLSPLMLTSLGRTGSSWLAWLLARHLGVTAFHPFAHDARVATYWMSVLQALAEPKSYLSQISASGFREPRWWLGNGQLATSSVADDAVGSWLATDALDELASVCQARVDAFYERAAPREEKPAARYFVEKAQPEGLPSDLALELYPESREVLLVRDFRDVLTSIFAFDAKRGGRAFGREQAESDEGYLARFVASAEVLLKRWRRRSADAHLVRYEDLVLDPAATLAGVFQHLALDADPRTVERVLDAAAQEVPGMCGHRTTPDAATSVGRWRRDLPSRLASEANEALAAALEGFGYSADR